MDGNVLFSSQDQNTAPQTQSTPPQGGPLPLPQNQPLQQPAATSISPTDTQMGGQQVTTRPVPPALPQNQGMQGMAPQPIPLEQSTQPVQPPVQPQLVQAQPAQPSPQIQQPALPPDDAPSDSPKITLHDLYGPSQTPLPPPPQQATDIAERSIPAVSSAVNTQSQQPLPVAPVSEGGITPQALFTKAMPGTASSMSSVGKDKDQSSQSPATSGGSGNGGFRFPPLLLRIIGGLVAVLILVICVSLVSSLFQHNNGDGKVTLTYWGLWEDSNVFQGVINDFQREHPTITVVYTKEDPVGYTDRLLTRMQNGSGPDIFRFHNTWVSPLQGVLLPLPSTVIDPKQLEQNYFPVVTKDLVKNGAVYGIPLQMDTLVMYTNKDMFDHAGVKVPTTWENFVTVSKGLTVKDTNGKIKTAGAALGTYENITHAPDVMSLLLMQNGADLQKLSGSQNAIDALNFYTSFSKTDDRVWDSTLDNSLTAFARGNVGMYFGYSYDYFAIKAQNPQLNFEIHPVPHLPGRDISIASYWVEGISSRSKHQKEALLFLKYLSQKDVMSKLYTEEAKTRAFGEIYPRVDLANSLSSDPILSPFVSQAKNAVSSFFASNTSFVGFNEGLNRYLGNAINGVLKDTSPDSAVESLAQGVAQIFSQYANSSQ